MSLAEQIKHLSQEHVTELHAALTLSGIVFETGGDYQEVFRIEKNRNPVGLLNRIYRKLQQADSEAINAMLGQLLIKET